MGCSGLPVTRCNTLQHAATQWNTLQYTATHCNTVEHTATQWNTLQSMGWGGLSAHAACDKLQHTATHCNTLAARGALAHHQVFYIKSFNNSTNYKAAH